MKWKSRLPNNPGSHYSKQNIILSVCFPQKYHKYVQRKNTVVVIYINTMKTTVDFDSTKLSNIKHGNKEKL